MKKTEILTNGLVKENPVLRLVLGTCPTLAVTTAAMNGIGMGLAATFVLICSNVVISACRKIIPDKVHIPAFITIIAGFVSVVQMLVKAYAPALDSALGVYLPLIVVNCIILGRAEMFACKNNVVDSALDGLGMGIGFTLTLFVMASIREILGAGTFFGIELIKNPDGDPFISSGRLLHFWYSHGCRCRAEQPRRPENQHRPREDGLCRLRWLRLG